MSSYKFNNFERGYMKRFKTLQTYLAFMMLILSVFLITGCGGHGGETDKWIGNEAPIVSSTVPADTNIVTDACVNQIITATFDKAMDPTTINSNPAGTLLTFTLKETVSGTNVPGTVAMNAPTNTIATFTPTANLTSGLNYTATISTAAKDSNGNALAAPIVWSFTTGSCLVAPTAPSVDLGSASTFGISATTGLVTAISASTVNADVLLYPDGVCNSTDTTAAGGIGSCAAIGFPPTISGKVIGPWYNPGPPAFSPLATIEADLNAAFLSICAPGVPSAACSLTGATNIPAGTTLGAATGSALVPGKNYFTPGVYQSLTSILITGDLTLDAQGDPTARFVFQSSSSIGMAAGSPTIYSRILLVGGAKASNVWWQASSSATVDTYGEFQGNILAAVSITLNDGATSCGRMLAGAWVGGGGAITLGGANVVSVPGQPFAPGGTRSTTCE
jgi:hypothetical protein